MWTAEEPVVIEPIDEITKVFRPWPYTGNSDEQKITTGTDTLTNGGLVWLKRRNSAIGHYLFDTVRGERNALSSHDTSAQAFFNQSMEYFDTDGFGLKVRTGLSIGSTQTSCRGHSRSALASWTSLSTRVLA